MGNANTNLLESEIQKKAIKLVWEKFSVKGMKLNIDKRNGYPDLIFWIPGGSPLMVEMKRSKEKLAPLQKVVHEELRDLEYAVCTCTSAIQVVKKVLAALRATKLSAKQKKYLNQVEKEL